MPENLNRFYISILALLNRHYLDRDTRWPRCVFLSRLSDLGECTANMLMQSSTSIRII